MPKLTKEYQVSEESDLYHTINNRMKSLSDLLVQKETLKDHKISLEGRRDKIIEMNTEHYREEPYAVQELDAMYQGIDEAFRYWLKKLDEQILNLEEIFVSEIWKYKTSFDEKEKQAQKMIHEDFVNSSEVPF